MNSRLLGIPEHIFVEEARANTRDKVAYMKLSVLVMLDEGLTQEMTAALLGVGLGAVDKSKFDDLRRAVMDFFENIDQYKWELKSLITPNFLRLSAVPGIR